MVLATSILVTDTKKAQKVRVLDQVYYIYYPVQFWKNKVKDVLALLNSERKVNTMSPAYMDQLDLKVHKTNIAVQKIDESLLKT